MTFIDFKATFDSVNRCKIWIICSSLGLGQIFLNLLKALYDETFRSTKTYDTLSSPFQGTTSVKQGSILSTLLFVIVIDWALREATQNRIFGMQLDEMTISDLDFADDICLLEDDFNATQELLSSVIAAAAKTGLVNNTKKTFA